MEVENTSAVINPNEGYIFYAKTTRSHIFAKILEAMNANVSDINLWITSSNVTALSTETTKQCTTHLRLDAKEFDEYYIAEGARVLVGINLPLLYKLVKDSIKAGNPLSIYVKNDAQKFYMRVDKRKNTSAPESASGFDDTSVPILTLAPQTPQLPSSSYRTMISMDSHTFLHICKMCEHTSSELIRISANMTKRQLTIESWGLQNPADKKVILAEADTDVVFRSVGEDFSALYTLRLCHKIAKASTLSDHVHLYMEPDQPLVFQFDAGNLGYLKFYLLPRSDD